MHRREPRDALLRPADRSRLQAQALALALTLALALAITLTLALGTYAAYVPREELGMHAVRALGLGVGVG